MADSIIVFDGVCVLCSRWVGFVLRRDRQGQYKFAAMQTPIGRDLLIAHGIDPDDPLSFLLLEGAAGLHRHRCNHSHPAQLRTRLEIPRVARVDRAALHPRSALSLGRATSLPACSDSARRASCLHADVADRFLR